MTTKTPPRPTSSRPRPTTRDDLPQVTSSLVPLPSGGRGHWSRPRRPERTPLHLVPGTTSGTTSTPPTHTPTNDHFHGGLR